MNTKHIFQVTAKQLRFLAHLFLALLFGLATGQATAGTLNISDTPLDVLEGVPANIIMTMDDSGSMAWSYIPDSIRYDDDEVYGLASNYNAMYYNPNITYEPAADENGASLGNSDFYNAWDNGLTQGSTCLVDLSKDYRASWRYGNHCSSSTSTQKWAGTKQAAYYYLYDAGLSGCSSSATDSNCYKKIVVSATSGPGNTDERQNFANWFSYYRKRHMLAKTAASRAFAGLSTSIRIAYQALNTSKIIGKTLPFAGSERSSFFNWLYKVPYSGSTPLRAAMSRAGEKYSEAGKNSPYAKEPGVDGTPEYSCRQNFHFAFTDGFWNSTGASPDPGNYDDSSALTLPTTGNSRYGDINYKSNKTLVADETPPIYRDSNTEYLADIAMYYWARDLRAGTNKLENDVPLYITDTATDIDGDGDTDNFDIFWNPANDPADWQHMVNFTVGLGIDGSLTYDGDDPANFTTDKATYNDLRTGTETWPGNGTTTDNTHVDDLWHAAVNSRGRYFSASNPTDLVNAFTSVLANIDSRTASSSAIATTSSQLLTGAILFQASYDPSQWSGEVKAFDAKLVDDPLNPDKKILQLSDKWLGSTALNSQLGSTGRQILTYSPAAGDGVPFEWLKLDAGQQLALNSLNGSADGKGLQRLDYLRGDNSNEQSNNGIFRNRTSPYGDIVHSDPEYVPPPGPPNTFYPDSLESVAYSTYGSSNSNRTEMLVFGGNDGMVHILNAQTGNELFAYVPSPVYRNLSNLTDPNYKHQFYVDSTPSVADVFYNGAWHTVAVGGLGKGGQGIYALDISNPGSFTEANAAGVVLWEFTDTDDADLGYSYTRPKLLKMNNGKWMAVFGNGLNSNEDDTATGGQQSSSGNAVLFMVDIENGGKGVNGIKIKLDTKKGIADDPTGAGRANRLTDVVAIDQNDDFMVDVLYAGDLFGNLWKIDVSSSNPNKWSFLGSGSTPKPLFVAKDPSGNPQPIMEAPSVTQHDKRSGYMLYFGTGKYVEVGDKTDTSIQTIYAVWDREESNFTTLERKYLLQQWMDFQGITKGINNEDVTYRTTTTNPLDWYDGSGVPTGATITQFLGWYIDLGVTASTSSPTIASPDGERLDKHLYVDSDQNVIEFLTLVPNDNPCDYGGDSWAYRLNATSGSGFLTTTPWDYNRDGKYGDPDKVNNADNVSVYGSGIQKPQRVRITKTVDISANECVEVNLLNYTDGTIGTEDGQCNIKELGRRSWRQIPIK